MKTIIHVNQHVIKKNRKTGAIEPPLTVKTYKKTKYGSRVDIKVKGEVVGTFVYSPNKPLSCGAHVWFETKEAVEVDMDGQPDWKRTREMCS